MLSRVFLGCLSILPMVGCRQDSSSPLTERPGGDQRESSAFSAFKSSVNLTAYGNSPGELAHWGLGLGGEFVILDESTGERYSIFEYFSRGGPVQTANIYSFDEFGPRVRVSNRYQYSEAHADQFLAYLAECGLSDDVTLTGEGGRQFTVREMVAAAQRRYSPAEECSWSLIAFCSYVGFGKEWTGRDGRRADLSMLVEQELNAREDQTSCGGAHRLYALATARRTAVRGSQHEEARVPRIEAVLQEAARRLANRQEADGHFATSTMGIEDFESLPERRKMSAKIFATGHQLEWLILFRNADTEPMIRKATAFLQQNLRDCAAVDMPAGWAGHALHAVRMAEDEGRGDE